MPPQQNLWINTGSPLCSSRTCGACRPARRRVVRATRVDRVHGRSRALPSFVERQAGACATSPDSGVRERAPAKRSPAAAAGRSAKHQVPAGNRAQLHGAHQRKAVNPGDGFHRGLSPARRDGESRLGTAKPPPCLGSRPSAADASKASAEPASTPESRASRMPTGRRGCHRH